MQPGAQAPDSQGGGDDARNYASTARQIAGKDIAGRDYEQRQRTETTARAELSHSTFNAPVYVASNFGLGFGQGATRLRVSRISAEELTEPFIQTPAIQRIAARITDPALVFLVGQRGHGKAAALVQILRDPTVGAAPMFYLDPSTDLTMFSCADVPEGSVLILQDLPDGRGRPPRRARRQADRGRAAGPALPAGNHGRAGGQAGRERHRRRGLRAGHARGAE